MPAWDESSGALLPHSSHNPPKNGGERGSMPVPNGQREKALTCTFVLVRASIPLVPPVGFEPTHPAPEAGTGPFRECPLDLGSYRTCWSSLTYR